MFRTRITAFLLSLPLALAACSDLGLDTDAKYESKDKQDLYKYGSVASDEGGISLFGGKDGKTDESMGLGVNGFLWRATLDVVSFMPLASADPFGGIILTDWYSPPETPNERTKLNVYIRGRDLSSDGVKVSVFRQTKSGDNVWADAPVAASTAGSMENAILTRARQIRLAQKQFQ
jgi:hypothetical protein